MGQLKGGGGAVGGEGRRKLKKRTKATAGFERTQRRGGM